MTVNSVVTPEFVPKEAIGYMNKNYEKAKVEILKKGYKFKKKEDGFYSFQKSKDGNKYTCTLTVLKGKIEGIIITEDCKNYSKILDNLKDDGYVFNESVAIEFPSGKETKFNHIPSLPRPSSMTRLDKQSKFTCFIVCPYNLKSETNLISINYSNYIKE